MLCMYMCLCMYLCTSTEVPPGLFSQALYFFFFWDTVLELADLDKQLQGFAHLRLPRAKIVHACHQAHLFLHGHWGSSSGPHVCAPDTLIADWSISPEQTNQPLKAQRSNLGFSSEKQYQSESYQPKRDKTCPPCSSIVVFLLSVQGSSASFPVQFSALGLVEGSRNQEASFLLGPLVFSKS